MRIFRKTLCWGLLLALLLIGGAQGERSVYFAGCDPNSPDYQAFVEAYPDVKADTQSNVYDNTDQVIGDFLTGQFPFDTFAMTTQSFNIRLLMEKGYLAPLTDDPVIAAAVEKMYAPIRELVTWNGEIYGLPTHCDVLYFAYNPETWEAAGLTQADVPASFTGLLDFLDAWILRIQENPEYEISVCSAFDMEFYGPYTYIGYLVGMLVDNHMMQCSYAGEPLRFDTPLFRELLARCRAIGEALYMLEPADRGAGLFESWSTLQNLRYLVPLRLTEEQPLLMKASMMANFINVRTREPELAKAFLALRAGHIAPLDRAYLYPDAESVENENQKVLMEAMAQVIAELEESLADPALPPEDRRALEDRLADKRASYQQISDPAKRYVISPEALETYRAYGPQLYFQPPSVFDASTPEGQNLRQLEDRFCAGGMTEAQFIRELDRLAWILESENAS